MADVLKETICSECVHLQVCSLKNKMLSVISSLDNLNVSLGENNYIKLLDIPWIKTKLECEYYLRKQFATYK